MLHEETNLITKYLRDTSLCWNSLEISKTRAVMLLVALNGGNTSEV
jgi:hypothetical protein